MSQAQKHDEMLNQFIDLANKLKDEGNETQLVSAAMMSATAVYTTYVHAGNEGYLHESGITKVVNAYEKYVRQVQAFKKATAEYTAQQQANNDDGNKNANSENAKTAQSEEHTQQES